METLDYAALDAATKVTDASPSVLPVAASIRNGRIELYIVDSRAGSTRLEYLSLNATAEQVRAAADGLRKQMCAARKQTQRRIRSERAAS